MEQQRGEVARRIWWRGWCRGFWVGLVSAAMGTAVGVSIAILAMSPVLSSRPDVITVAGIAVGGACTAAVVSASVCIGTLIDHRQRQRRKK